MSQENYATVTSSSHQATIRIPTTASHGEETSSSRSEREQNAHPHGGSSLTGDTRNDQSTRLPRSSTGKIVDQSQVPAYLLSFDGGGIRGFSSLLLIQALMVKIGEHERRANTLASHSHFPTPYRVPQGSENSPRAHTASFRYLPCHYFDFVAGTSTGGLIAIMLSRLRMTIDDCIDEYEKFGDAIFGHPRLFHIRGPLYFPHEKYKSRWLRKTVHDVVSRRHPSTRESTMLLKNLKSPPDLCKTMIFSVRKETDGVEKPYLFRSYDHQPHGDFQEQVLRLNPGPAHEVPLADVALATAAAPTYFKRHTINHDLFLDGGFGANNPTNFAFQEIQQLKRYPEYPVALVLSIGTGKSHFISRFGDGPLGRYYQYLKFAKKMASDSERGHLDMQLRLQGQRENPEAHAHRIVTYERFNVETGLEDMKLDEWKTKSWMGFRLDSNKTIDTIRAATKSYVDREDVQDKLDFIAGRLVQNRIDRSKRDSWERVCTGVQWLCPHCGYEISPFFLPTELRRHLFESHVGHWGPGATAEHRATMDDVIESARTVP